MLTNKILL